jgi:predicted DNA-binding transcriptional regulator AlpA
MLISTVEPVCFSQVTAMDCKAWRWNGRPMVTKKNSREKRKIDSKAVAVKVSDKVSAMPLNLLLTIPEVTELTGMCYETLWRRWTTKKMPRPLDMGHRTKRFRVADIKAWVEDGCRRWPIPPASKK